MRRLVFVGSILLAVVALGCGSGEAPKDRGAGEVQSPESVGALPLSVYVVNYPLAYFAERIGGDQVEVVFPTPAGEDPAYWSPNAATVAEMQQADLILLNGAGYAKWVDRVSLPAGKLVDTSAAFADRLLPLEAAVTHSHGPAGEHEHVGYAFTTWLDPELAIEQARAVAAAFTKARPDGAGSFGEALGILETDLRSLDSRLAQTAAKLAGEPLVFSHPVYQYLIHRFGLDARSVHWEPDEAPGQRAWLELQKMLGDHPAAWMIWESEPRPEIVERLQELGLESIVFDPSANVSENGNFLTVMQSNAEVLKRIAASVN